jgi:hypothetical protein
VFLIAISFLLVGFIFLVNRQRRGDRGSSPAAIAAWVIGGVALVLLMVGVGGGDGEGQAKARVYFAAPLDGSSVTSPVAVTMASENFVIEPAGQPTKGAGHFHVMVDDPCVEPGVAIPADPTHVHFGAGQTEATLDLPPGEHTLCLQAGDGSHVALPATNQISVAVVR